MSKKSIGLIGTIVDKSKATKTLNMCIPAYSEDSYIMRYSGNMGYKRINNKEQKNSFLNFIFKSLFFLK